MKVLHVNTYDTRGGAARAALRLVQGCHAEQIDASLLVKRKLGNSPGVWCSRSLLTRLRSPFSYRLDSHLMRKNYPNRIGNISTQWFSALSAEELNRSDADIIHLHWVLDGFLSVEEIAAIRKPIVWTMHDMWPLTGGCHYSYDCEKWRTGCGACPHLCSNNGEDLTHQIWRRKEIAWKLQAITFIAPCRWIEGCVRDHPFLKRNPVETILHGIDLQTFQPMDKTVARRRLSLPEKTPLILFGAVDLDAPGKGGPLLVEALKIVQQKKPDAELVLFGASAGQPDFPLKTHALGYLSDEDLLRTAYASCDAFVSAGIFETGPMTVMEAAACKTASVGLRAGGTPDRIEHGKTGYLAEPGSADDLAAGILTVLENAETFGEGAYAKAQVEFSVRHQSANHRALYEQVLTDEKLKNKHASSTRIRRKNYLFNGVARP